MATRFTVIDDGRAAEVGVWLDGDRVVLSREALRELAGAAPDPPGEEVDLAALAARLGRPIAIDLAERAAWLGVSAAERARALGSLEAPDVELPDLDGRLHRLGDHRGRKVLLVVWASW